MQPQRQPRQPSASIALRTAVLAVSPRGRAAALVRHAQPQLREYLENSDLSKVEGMTEEELGNFVRTLPMRAGSASSRAAKRPKANTPPEKKAGSKGQSGGG
jgi:hypothetical protein